MLADRRSPLGQKAAALGTVSDVFQRRFHEPDVAELGLAGFHEKAKRRADLDGVAAQVIDGLVQTRHVVGIGKADVGAEQADGLIFQGRDDFLAVFVDMVHPGDFAESLDRFIIGGKDDIRAQQDPVIEQPREHILRWRLGHHVQPLLSDI